MLGKIDSQEYIKRIEKALPVKALDAPKRGWDKIRLFCFVCGHVWKAAPSNIVRGGKAHFGCPECGLKKQGPVPLSKQKITRRLKLAGLKAKMIEFYGTGKRACFRCCVCSGVWFQWPAHVVSASGILKTGCPYCAPVSKGEKSIAAFLKSKGVVFERQKRFEECRNKRPLPFDFYIPSQKTLVEYQGEMHFKPSRFRDGMRKFEKIKKHDFIKQEWAASNGYRLIELWHTDDVEKLLGFCFPQRG